MAENSSLVELFADDLKVHIPPDFAEQIAPHLEAFEYFSKFPYESWKPNQTRVDFVTRYASSERLLDIACGGHPVTAEIQIPYKAGMDISPKAAVMAKDTFDDFYLCDFSATTTEYLQQLGTFDTIVCSEFLEHTRDSSAVIQKMLPLLNPDGKLIITVPSGESMAMRLDKYLHHGEWKRFEWFHKTHFNLLSLPEWKEIFVEARLVEKVFDFRPSDLVEGFPKENFPGWKQVCALAPRYLGHQYFFVLEKKN